MFNKKLNIKGLFSLVCVFSISFSQNQPNIIFVFTDDHAAPSIGAYNGYLKDVALTPSLDRLAKEGMLFKKCYVTNSLCGPSRAVVQTGKYSHKNGFYKNNSNFNDNQPTFVKILSSNGYETAVIGKWHLGEDPPQGFSYWEIMRGQGTYYNPEFKTGNLNGQVSGYRRIEGYNSEIVGNLALEWLENKRDKSKPFMLMYQFKATHGHFHPGPGDYNAFDSVTIPEPETMYDDYSYRGSAVAHANLSVRDGDMDRVYMKLDKPKNWDHAVTGWTVSQKNTWNTYYDSVITDFNNKGYNWNSTTDDDFYRWKFQRYLKDYLATTLGFDRQVGRMLNYLDQTGLVDSTVVIYSSDQGFYLTEHGWFDKRFMYEESLNSPLIVRWPGVVVPETINENDIVSNLDFAETFLEIAGLSIPGDMQGVSLVPIFEGNTPSNWRKSFYYHYYDGPAGVHNIYRHWGVTTGRYKLIYFNDIDEWEFYDLKKDPNELINQYYIPENDSIISALKIEINRLRTELEVDQGPGPNNGNSATINYQTWTTPLKLGGCMDPTFLEYDSEADSSVAEACKTLSVKKINSKLQDVILVENNFENTISITFQEGFGKISKIIIFDLKGFPIKKITGSASDKIVLMKNDFNSGVFILKIIRGESIQTKKMVL